MGPLVTTVVWALFTANALWPPFRRGPLGFAVFVLAMAVNEIPLVLLVVFLASLAIGVIEDSATIGTAGALPTAGLAAVVVLGLVWLQVRARTARPAFDAGLAGGPAGNEPPPDSRDRDNQHWLGGILAPFARRPAAVRRIRNVRYGPHGRAHLLDVYRPRAPMPPGPVLIHLHGGGFVQGAKSREGVVLLNRLAAHGWLCLSANYRLRAAGRFPNPLEDTKRVIAWAREHARDFGADPSQVFLVGSSAGGHLALSAALTANQPRFQPGFENADTGVAAAVVVYGYLGARTADPGSSPAALGHRGAPPVLIVHGAHDTAIPAAGPRAVAAALRAVSASPVRYVELPCTQHDFDFFASVRARVTADAIEQFLEQASAGARRNARSGDATGTA